MTQQFNVHNVGVDRDKIARLLRLDDAKTLITRVVERREEIRKSLQAARDVIDIHRYQGNLDVLDWILSFREE